MRVLLISANTERINLTVLPLGLAQVAAATVQAGHEVSVLNLMLEERVGEALDRAIRSFEPGVIGISVRNVDDQNMQAPRFLLEPVREVVRACRAASNAPIVLGGAGYSIFPAAALAWLGADYGVCGEGECAFPALLARLERRDLGEGGESVPGLYAKGGPVSQPAQPARNRPAVDLDACRSPDPSHWLVSAPRDSWVPVQSRRGCPLDCAYCSTASIEGRRIRRRSPRLVAEDLARARALGFRNFYFVDNTFNLPDSYATSLCREIARRDLGVTWRCIVYPSGLTHTLAREMREAGCVEASVGFESGSARMLRALNKRFTLDDVRATCARLSEYGIRRNGFLLLGGPGETDASVDESMAFSASLRLDTLKVTLGIRIYPGTSLHRRALAEGMVAPDDDLLRPTFYLARGIDASRIAVGVQG